MCCSSAAFVAGISSRALDFWMKSSLLASFTSMMSLILLYMSTTKHSNSDLDNSDITWHLHELTEGLGHFRESPPSSPCRFFLFQQMLTLSHPASVWNNREWHKYLDPVYWPLHEPQCIWSWCLYREQFTFPLAWSSTAKTTMSVSTVRIVTFLQPLLNSIWHMQKQTYVCFLVTTWSEVTLGRRAEQSFPSSGRGIQNLKNQICFVLINTQEVFPVLWQCSGLNHPPPDSLPSLLPFRLSGM